MVVKPGDRRKILTSGLFVIMLSSLVLFSVFLINRESSIFGKRVQLKTRVSNVNNLKIGGAVQLRGIKIGSVSDITFEGLERIVITFSILEDYLEWIKADSTIAIRTQGVLGDKFIEISGGSESSAYVKANDFIIAKTKNEFDSFLDKGEDILVVSKRVLQKIDALLTSMESSKISSIVSNLEETSIKMNNLMTPLTPERFDTVINNFTSATNDFSALTKRIKDGPGTLHSLIFDRALHDDMKSLMGGAKRNQVIKYFVRESIKKNTD